MGYLDVRLVGSSQTVPAHDGYDRVRADIDQMLMQRIVDRMIMDTFRERANNMHVLGVAFVLVIRTRIGRGLVTLVVADHITRIQLAGVVEPAPEAMERQSLHCRKHTRPMIVQILKRRSLESATQEKRTSHIRLEQSPTALTQIQTLACNIGQRTVPIQILIKGTERLKFHHAVHAIPAHLGSVPLALLSHRMWLGTALQLVAWDWRCHQKKRRSTRLRVPCASVVEDLRLSNGAGRRGSRDGS